jgi:hypothetical protein
MTTMPERPAAAARTCAVLGCEATSTDPAHVVDVAPAATLPYRVPICPAHRRSLDEGGDWFAEETSGERGRPGVGIVTGDELVARRLVVAREDEVGWRRGGFTPRLDPDRNFGVLHVEGRVHGSDDRAHMDLVLTPDVVRTLRSVVRLYDAQQQDAQQQDAQRQ